MKRNEPRSVKILKSEETLEIFISSGKSGFQTLKILVLEIVRYSVFLGIMYYFCLLYLGETLSKEESFILMIFPLLALTSEIFKAFFDLFVKKYMKVSSSKIFVECKINDVTLHKYFRAGFRASKIIAYPIFKQQTFVWGKRDLIYKPFLIIDLGKDKVKLRNKYVCVSEIEELAMLLSQHLGCPLELEYLR